MKSKHYYLAVWLFFAGFFFLSGIGYAQITSGGAAQNTQEDTKKVSTNNGGFYLGFIRSSPSGVWKEPVSSSASLMQSYFGVGGLGAFSGAGAEMGFYSLFRATEDSPFRYGTDWSIDFTTTPFDWESIGPEYPGNDEGYFDPFYFISLKAGPAVRYQPIEHLRLVAAFRFGVSWSKAGEFYHTYYQSGVEKTIEVDPTYDFALFSLIGTEFDLGFVFEPRILISYRVFYFALNATFRKMNYQDLEYSIYEDYDYVFHEQSETKLKTNQINFSVGFVF